MVRNIVYAIVALVAVIAASLASSGQLGFDISVPDRTTGVVKGLALAREYYPINVTREMTTPLGLTLVNGTFILLDGYLIDGRPIQPREVTMSYIEGAVIVYDGEALVYRGVSKQVGNYTVVEGVGDKPAKVFVVKALVWYP
jgi:hypothetical protein